MRVEGLIRTLIGFLTAFVGFGMYRNPHLDWNSLIQTFPDAFSILVDQINYFIEDPFALVGFIIMLVGVSVFLEGIKALLLKKGKESTVRE